MICQSVEKLSVVICSQTTQSCFLLIILLYSMILILLQTDVLQMICRSIKINSHCFQRQFYSSCDGQQPGHNCLKCSERPGLLVSDDLNWMTHINKKLLSCNKSLYFIKRNFSFTVSQSTKLMFVILCIKSIIFYASPVCFPLLCFVRKLENFNRKCLKWVIGSIPYKDQLFLTENLPICYHLIFNDVLLFYKRFLGFTELPFSAHFFFKVSTSLKTTILCAVQTAKKWQTKKFFFHRVEKSVNELFRFGVDIFAPLATFRRRVKELLQFLIN